MRFFKNIFTALKSYPSAIKFVYNNKLGKYFIWPFAVFALYYLGIGSVVAMIADSLIEVVDAMLFGFVSDSSWTSWIGEIGHFFIKLAVKTMMFFVMAYFSGFVILMMMGPILGSLAEKVEEAKTGRFASSMKVQDVFSSLWRGIVTNLRSMAWETIFIILMFFFAMIPVVGIIAPVALFIISAYFLGMGFMDGFAGRSISESGQYARKNKGLAISHGAVFALALMVPYLGTLTACFVAILATVAATISMADLEKNEEPEV